MVTEKVERSVVAPLIIQATPQGVARAADLLRQGGVGAFPTETTYGVTVDPWNGAALRRLLALKGRPSAMTLPLVLPSTRHVSTVAAQVPEAAALLMARHWPGPLTLILPARRDLPAALVSDRGVGVRVSSHPVASALALAMECAIVATSANPHGAPAACTAADVVRCLPALDFVLDGGAAPGAPPSTVVAVDSGGRLTVLRRGAIEIHV